MFHNSKINLLLLLITLLPTAMASAHHSHAMFEDVTEVTLSGIVFGVRFINPHVKMLLEVHNENRETARWDIEMSDVNNMMNRGINRATFSVGDEVIISVNPLRNGRAGGNYAHIISINGIHNNAEGSFWSPASAD